MNEKKAINILLVEDYEDHVGLIRRVFKASKLGSVNLTFVKTVQEARKILAESTPDLAIIDYKLPDGEGIELLQPKPSYPTIIMTGQGDEKLAVTSLKAGALDYCVKSEEMFRDMPHTAERVLREWENIHERKKMEFELHKIYNLLKAVADNTKDAIFVKDCQGRYLLINKAGEEIVGKPVEEILGKTDEQLFPPEIGRRIMQEDSSIMASGKTHSFEETIQTSKGDIFTFLTTKAVSCDQHGKVTRIVGISHNITDRKNAEKELNKYASEMQQLAEERSKQLIHADRMVTLGTLSAGVAHEINNPVGFISNNLQIFEKFWDRSIRDYLEKAKGKNEDKNLAFILDEMPRMVKSMKEGTKRIANIVHNLGKFSRQTELDFKLSDISKVLEVAVKFCRPGLAVKHKFKIQLDLQNDIPNIKISRQEIEQVIINLITNSAHAMEKITDRKELILKIAASHVSNDIVIKITDNGYGMDEKTLTNIFNPFFTTKGVGEGTGLGLSICRGIIEQHRGTITATSTLGEGTTFTITLPIDPQKKERRKKDEKNYIRLREEDKLPSD